MLLEDEAAKLVRDNVFDSLVGYAAKIFKDYLEDYFEDRETEEDQSDIRKS